MTGTMLLSCAHVIGNPSQRDRFGATGQVVQPGRAAGGNVPDHAVANVHSVAPISLGAASNNTADAALALVRDAGLLPTDIGRLPPKDFRHGEWPKPPIRLTGVFSGMLEPGMQVWKYGIATGWTFGEVIANRIGIKVEFGWSENPSFTDAVEIACTVHERNFAAGGDSGGPVVLPNGELAGIVFAGTDTGAPNGSALGFANPIGHVLSQLNATGCVSGN
jgi:hypothetical protein